MEEKSQPSSQPVLTSPAADTSRIEEQAAPTETASPSKGPAEETKIKKQTAIEAEQFIGKDHSDSNMVVAIRVRPLATKETSNGDFETVSIEDKLLIVHDPRELESEGKHLDVLHRSKEQRFFFDKIFKNTSQEVVYQNTCRHLIRPILDGYNATVFAYGTTGSGKTYTMVGTQEAPGIMALTLRDMFAAITEDKEREYDVKVSYVEIYNEVIHDLLVPNSKDTYLELRDDPLKGVTIAGVTEIKVDDSKHVMNLLLQGNRRRTTEATNANQTSSRSHAVFQISVSSREKTKSTDVEVLCGKLSLIDLAGSERGSVTENRGIRLMEGAKINRSLLSLANCINALGDKSKKGFFVPYRDSKLTRMLKDSLGGNCKTVMITTISPASSQYEETVNSLKYASRAKDLRDEIERLKAQVKVGNNNALAIKPGPTVTKCTCGRGEDEEMKQQIHKEVAQAYDDIMQLEQALIELDEQNTMNAIEIKKREAKILIFFNSLIEKQGKEIEVEDVNSINLDQLETDDPETKGAKEQIKRQKEKIGILKENTKKNIEKRQLMKKELLESYELIRKIRQEIPSKIKHQEAREYLELIIKNNFLEAQNVQLLLNLQLQARTISQLKSMIMRQQRFIQENHLDSGENIAKVFSGKQFDELEEDEDYKRLLVASPGANGKSKGGKAKKLEPVGEMEYSTEQNPVAPQVEELVGLITGEAIPSEEINTGPGQQELADEQAEYSNTKEETKGEENKEMSVAGVPVFKIEGRSVGPIQASTEKEKKSISIKQKSTKESKVSGKGVSVQPQPANLSVMGSKIAAKKGAAAAKGKAK